jgi:23S rRNA (uracil1939-C5)-methyltransferase
MITLQMTKMAYNGYSIGRHDGKVIFVPHALPGERVEAEVTEDRMNWAKAKLIKVLDSSPQRVEPRCAHFGPGNCGGCHWQHIDYSAQLEFKTQIVKEQVRRLGGILENVVEPAVPAGTPWAYRNHVQLHGGVQGWGFVKEDQSGILPIKACPIMHQGLKELLPPSFPSDNIQKLILRTSAGTGERMMLVEVGTGFKESLSAPEGVSLMLCRDKRKPRLLAGSDHFFEMVGGLRFHVSAKSFFQVNTQGAEKLVELVQKWARPRPGQTAVDLYSGAGLFALHLVSEGIQISAVESDPLAAADLRINCQGAGQDRIRIFEKTVRSALGKEIKSADVVVCDPPRRGCGHDVIRKIGRLKPGRLVYVSCDPATLARDARYLTQEGYSLFWVQPVDFFPQTYHIESVSLFERR